MLRYRKRANPPLLAFPASRAPRPVGRLTSRRTWSTPVEIFAPLTGPQTGTIGTWYTDDEKFGPLLRFAVEAANASGTAIESARLTVLLQVELKS